MSAAYGISSFVDGFFQGRNWRNSQEDRKDEKARQKKLDEITFAREARAADEYGWTKSQREKAAADEEALRKAYAESVDAANGSFGATPPDAAPQSSPVDPVTGVAANLGIHMGAIQPSQQGQPPNELLPAMRVMAGQVMPQPAGPRRASVEPAGPAFEQSGRGVPPSPVQRAASLAPETSPRPQENPAGRYGPAFERVGREGQQRAQPQQTSTQQPQRQGPDGYIVAPAPSAAIADELYQQGPAGVRYIQDPNSKSGPAFEKTGRSAAPIPMGIMEPDYNHKWGEDGGLLSDAGEAAKRANRAVDGIPQGAFNLIQDAAGVTNTALNPWVKYATGTELPMPPSWQENGNGGATGKFDPPTQPAQPAAAAPPKGVGPLKANLPKGATPQQQASADSAVNAMAEAASPAVEAAAAAAAPEVAAMGAIDPSKGPTQAQKDRASASFMEQYIKVGAPMVVEELLRQGKVDKAQEFMTFIEQGKTKEAMKNWAQAAFAITNGDIDTFAENIIEGYSLRGYYPDGLSIVKDKSHAIKGKDGTTSGYIVTFKDDATGNTFEQVYDSVDDMVLAGMTMLDPKNAFDLISAQNEAAKAAALGVQEKADKKTTEQDKQVIDLMTELMKSPENMGKPIEEIKAMAEAAIRGAPKPIPGGARSGGAPPIAYRP
jgi:hypothetical protein